MSDRLLVVGYLAGWASFVCVLSAVGEGSRLWLSAGVLFFIICVLSLMCSEKMV